MKLDVNYHSYLQLDQILSAQTPLSAAASTPAHDEMLFIITHQTYELWFKQILTELDSVLKIFAQSRVADQEMGVVVGRLERIAAIEKVLLAQIDILETMTPLDFLEFRDYLTPASGFQSAQFRLVENKLGLKRDKRLTYNACAYHESLATQAQAPVLESEAAPSLFDLIEKWLERTPFLQVGDYHFWKQYQQAVMTMLIRDQQMVEHHPQLDEAIKRAQLEQMRKTQESFQAFFDETHYTQLQAQGLWRLSYRAVHAALLIQLYRDQPALQLPHRLLTALLNIDEGFTSWRLRHAQMVMRMLGDKMGTGGSSGHRYLKQTVDQHKIFTDFFNLATYYIPRSQLPALPAEIQRMVRYGYDNYQDLGLRTQDSGPEGMVAF